jgi:hypothetical protein
MSCLKHVSYFDECIDCMKHDCYESYFDKLSYMYPDHAEGKPGDFLEGTLVALKPVNVYSAPDSGRILRSVKANQPVGKIVSYVVRNGVVWWQLYEGGFVAHGTGLFDAKMLDTSIAVEKQKEAAIVKKATDEHIAKNTNPLYNAGKTIDDLIPDFSTIKWVLIGLLVLVVVTMIYKMLK